MADLDSTLGRAVIDAARGLDPLAARGFLRRRFPDAGDDLIRAATVQAELAGRAAPRFGSMAQEVLWSSDGLEQASRPGVARYRARRLAAAGVRSAVDLTSGLAIDALAMAAEGIDVLAVEQDPMTAGLAAANARRLGGGHIEVVQGSCTDAATLDRAAGADAWFVDPSRRTQRRGHDGRHRRLDDPERWSPPWSWVVAQAGTPPVLMAKAAPGLPLDAIVQVPGCTADAEWVSQDGRLLETCVTWWRADVPGAPDGGTVHGANPDEDRAPRRAAVMLDAAGDVTLRIDAGQEPSRGTDTATPRPAVTAAVAPAGPPIAGEYLIDPDPAIVRSGTVADVAGLAGARLADQHLAYLVRANPLAPALRAAGRSWLVLEVGDYNPRRLREQCREHGVDHIEVTGRGRHLDATRVRRDLRLAAGGGQRGVLVVMAIGASRSTLVCLCRET